MQAHSHFASSVIRIAIMISVFCGTSSRVAYADFTFFSDRDAWESEATTGGFLFAEENFDSFPDNPRGIPSFTVGDVRFNPGALAGTVQRGKLVPRNGTQVHFGRRRPFGGDGGSVVGNIGGIGMDLEVIDSTFERSLSLLDCESLGFIPGEGQDLIPLCESTRESYLGTGFIGVLFGSPNEAQGFTFGIGSDRFPHGADNLVVAGFPVPEPSTIYLATIAALTLGFTSRINRC